MTATSHPTGFSSPILPVPGWLFYAEVLPLQETSTSAIEDLVSLSLESHAPLPLEHLAYGWSQVEDGKSVLYYAGARERLRFLGNGALEKAGFVVPDFVFAPEGKENVWQWIATPCGVTALRWGKKNTGAFELRSWPLSLAEQENWKVQVRQERALREGQLEGEHDPEFWGWDEEGVRIKGKYLQVSWKGFRSEKSVTKTLSLAAAWSADVRERSWLKLTRKARQQELLFGRLTLLGLACGLLVTCLWVVFLVYGHKVDLEAGRLAERQKEVDSVLSKSDLVGRLNEMEAGRVSFYDALATLNHYRPTDVLFTKAVLGSNQQIQINGSGASIGQINAYINSLRSDGSFSKVDSPKITTQNGQTTFTFQATIGDLRVSRSVAGLYEEPSLETTASEEQIDLAPMDRRPLVGMERMQGERMGGEGMPPPPPLERVMASPRSAGSAGGQNNAEKPTVNDN